MRQRLGLTIPALAERLGVSHDTVQRQERAEEPAPWFALAVAHLACLAPKRRGRPPKRTVAAGAEG